MTLAFLENQLASALTLQSAQEYRYWLLIYARFLVNEGTKLSAEGTNISFEYCRCVLIENEKWWKVKQPRCFQKIWTQLSDWTGGNCRKASLHSVICSTQALYKQLLYFIYFSVFPSRLRVSPQRTLQGAPGSCPQISGYILGAHHTGTTTKISLFLLILSFNMIQSPLDINSFY